MRNIVLFLLCISFLATTGCGNKKMATNMVTGIVTLDGAPLADATVTFSPVAEGMLAVGRTDNAGQFTLQTQLGGVGKGTTEGEYAITVSKISAEPTGKTYTNESGETVDAVEDKQHVPAIYTKAKTSPLKHTIVKGKNTVTLDLSSKP